MTENKITKECIIENHLRRHDYTGEGYNLQKKELKKLSIVDIAWWSVHRAALINEQLCIYEVIFFLKLFKNCPTRMRFTLKNNYTYECKSIDDYTKYRVDLVLDSQKSCYDLLQFVIEFNNKISLSCLYDNHNLKKRLEIAVTNKESKKYYEQASNDTTEMPKEGFSSCFSSEEIEQLSHFEEW